MTEVPTIVLPHLSDAQKRALRIADNKIALGAGWDLDLLKLELTELAVMDVDLDLALSRREDLALHPTVKPTALVADAIQDVTRRGDLVLDIFLGSGTTLIAAERTGRRFRGIDIDPAYVDVALERWSAMTGREPRLATEGDR
jgi:DNA modification methylase